MMNTRSFYKHISHDWNEPLVTWSFRAEGRSEISVTSVRPL